MLEARCAFWPKNAKNTCTSSRHAYTKIIRAQCSRKRFNRNVPNARACGLQCKRMYTGLIGWGRAHHEIYQYFTTVPLDLLRFDVSQNTLFIVSSRVYR